MEDPVGAIKFSFKGCRIGDVALMEAQSRAILEMDKVFRPAGGIVVDDNHGMAVIEQSLGHMAADKAGAACDKASLCISRDHNTDRPPSMIRFCPVI